MIYELTVQTRALRVTCETSYEMGEKRNARQGCQPTRVTMATIVRIKRNRIGSPYVDEPALGHGSELLDVFATGGRERHGLGQLCQ